MKKNFIILFSINLVLRVLMQGLLPLYPIIAEKLGASKSNNGLLLAASYSMLLFGTWLSGKIIPRFISAKILLLVSVVPVSIALICFGNATNLNIFLITSLALFFSVGVNITSGLILITYYSSQENIGVNFGIIGLSNLLGSILGGFLVGPVLFKFGNSVAFFLFSIVWIFVGVLSFFVNKPIINLVTKTKRKFKFTQQFVLLLISIVLITMLVHLFIFSVSLLLKQDGYNVKDISLFSAIGSLIVLPMPYLFGKWTLKYNPKKLLLLVYCLMLFALVFILLFKTIPIIILSISFMSILAYSSRPIIVAMTFKWFKESEKAMSQAYLSVAAWLSAIIGYIITGELLQRTNYNTTIYFGISIALVSILLLLFGIKSHYRPYEMDVDISL